MARLIGSDHADLNMKSTGLHVIGDMLTSVGVLAAGVVILYGLAPGRPDCQARSSASS